MSEPIDFLSDSNQQQMYMLDRLYGLPEFVKNAAFESTDALTGLPDSSFADPRRRKFPCHTKAATWLANAYFQQSRGAYPKDEATFVQGRITKYASHWKIQSLVNAFNTVHAKLASANSPDLQDKDYALVAVTEDGQKVRRMPINNPVNIKHAGEFLYANREKYPYSWRKTAARNILKAASEWGHKAAENDISAQSELMFTRFNDDTADYLERASGFGITHPRRAAEKIASRVMMLGSNHKDIQTKLAHIATTLKDMDIVKPEQLQKLAEIVDRVDIQTGLNHHYTDGVDMPEDIFFSVLEKEAAMADLQHVVLTTGTVIDLMDLAGLPLNKVAEIMGDEFKEAVQSESGMYVDLEKFAEVIPTLPRCDAVLLEKALKDVSEEREANHGIKQAFNLDLLTKEAITDYLKKKGHNVFETDYQLNVRMETNQRA
jgi:hypothetical protein